MSTKPEDTTTEAWSTQRQILGRIGPAARLATAIDLSEAVREIQIEGVLARNPGWGRADAVHHIVAANLGVDLPRHS
jgi:hypothetical protein